MGGKRTPAEAERLLVDTGNPRMISDREGDMSKRLRSTWFMVAPQIAVTALVAGASSLLAAGTTHSALHIRPGLWEFNSTAKVVGDSVFRDALLGGVPAAQRAQHLAWLRQ